MRLDSTRTAVPSSFDQAPVVGTDGDASSYKMNANPCWTCVFFSATSFLSIDSPLY